MERNRWWGEVVETDCVAERFWCLHCECVYPIRWSRLVKDEEGALLTYCADPTCNGCGPFFDLYPWQEVDDENDGGIPRFVSGVPDGGRVPLYP